MCDSEVIIARSPTKALASSPASTPIGLISSSNSSKNNHQEQLQHPTEMEQQNQVLLRNMEEMEMAKETYWLREKLKEMTSDRDRLLCEVANLRLELDMMELKRLPDDNK